MAGRRDGAIYLDHAATSWPKPPEVIAAVGDYLQRAGGSPGRSAHRLSIEAGRAIQAAREDAAALFGIADPMRVVFTSGATQAINTALFGLLRPGDEVVAGGVEHNAVMRPLRALERRGVGVIVAAGTRDGATDPEGLETAIRASAAGGRLRLLVINHASNVCGTIAPLREITRLAHDAGALVLVDAAQTAGVLPIDVGRDGIDMLAFTGHKGLHGPQGTGGLVLADSFDAARLEPLVFGGTGSRSDSEEQPVFLPDRFESGTPNGPGIAGLGAGLRWVRDRGAAATREHEMLMTRALIDGLRGIDGVSVYGPEAPEARVAVVSFTVAGRRVSEIGWRLDHEHGVLCRVGLHCAPAAHRAIGTFPEGTVRFAPGPLTTEADIQAALEAVARVIEE
jgi:cysteine desulfurase family protein